MSAQIIGLQDWFESPAGRYMLAWEQARFDEAVADVFGYHALQLGVPQLQALRSNRMPHHWLATPGVPAGAVVAKADCAPSVRTGDLVTEFAALPFSANSLDLIVLPHALELHGDPHATLREVERVLMPEGRVVICGLNPLSLWGFRQSRGLLYQRLGWGEPLVPEAGEFIGYWRLRDWLRLLSLEVESSRFGCYRPAVRSETWLQRWAWTDRAGPRWWPILGAVYFLVAVKRVRGMRLLGPSWRSARSTASAPVSIASSSHHKDLPQ